MLPNVRIDYKNGNLSGVIRYASGVAGLIGTGAAVSGKIGIGDPRLIFNLNEAIALGIDQTNNPVAYRHVKEFYDEAGDGAELYVMLVPNTMSQALMHDNTDLTGARKLLSFAQGRIRIYGSFYTPASGYTPITTSGLDAEVFTAVNNGQVLATAFATAQTPVRGLVEGRLFTGSAAALTDLLTMSNNRMGIVVASTLNDGTASIGLALGRLAKIPVQRKLARVKDGPLNIAAAYVGATTVEASTQLGLMHDKGYIVARTFPGLSGYFFSDDVMATKATDDYRFMARGRTIDKAAVLAYVTYIEELHDEIIINPDGTLDAGQVKFLESKIEKIINNSMTANREISGVTCSIDPAQNVTVTNQTKVVLKLRSVAYNSDIVVELGFATPQ